MWLLWVVNKVKLLRKTAITSSNIIVINVDKWSACLLLQTFYILCRRRKRKLEWKKLYNLQHLYNLEMTFKVSKVVTPEGPVDDWQRDLVNSCRKCKGFLIYFYHENDVVDCDTNNNNNNIGIVNIMYQFPETTK